MAHPIPVVLHDLCGVPQLLGVLNQIVVGHSTLGQRGHGDRPGQLVRYRHVDLDRHLDGSGLDDDSITDAGGQRWQQAQ